MKRITLLFVTLALLCGAGCSFFRSEPLSDKDDGPILFVESGMVIQEDRLKQGGDLLVVPFSAGVNGDC